MMFLNKLKNVARNRGMTYVELIVVLGIFATMASVSIYNYGLFQGKVDMRNLANDVALKIVQAQKDSSLGKFPSETSPQYSLITPEEWKEWKPSYGLYFGRASDVNKSFTYYIDSNNNFYAGSGCVGECLEKIDITKGNYISNLQVFYQNDPNAYQLNHLQVKFVRPSLDAILMGTPAFTLPVSYVQITVASPRGETSTIKIYPSGRIQVN